jgi:4-hydroxythreonine-4-phosphate dehydrogenase
MGDPLGIGPEVVLKSIVALMAAPDRFPQGLRLRIFADPAWMGQCARLLGFDTVALGLAAPIARGSALNGLSYPKGAVKVQWMPACIVPPGLAMGSAHAAAGQCAVECVRAAAKSVLAGDCRAIVTAPVSKQAMFMAGYPYPGHTELLAELAGGVPVRMMLMNRHLCTVLLSVHLSLREALQFLTLERVLETLRIADRSLAALLNRRPRLQVAGLNPHAGEAGAFGREEIEVIGPGIAHAQAEGLDVRGPFSPDTVFARAWDNPAVDAVVAMYHDQGLIPIKLAGLDEGVNLTLGLPFIRTSPDHGTAPDIAGKGVAREDSMLEAILLAQELSAKNGPKLLAWRSSQAASP